MDKGTIVRTVLLALTWINVFLQQNDLQPVPYLDEEQISLGLALVVSIWAWFKNNYITLKGKKQKEVLKQKGLSK